MNEITITASTLEGIRDAITRIARIIQAPDKLLPTYSSSIDGGHPHIELDLHGFHYVVVERGHEFERRTTRDPNELAYWVFDSVTFSMAADFELRNRKELQDCRRMMFQKQLELLKELDDSWMERKKRDHEAVLKEHPFDDYSSVRAKLTGKLRDEGHPNEEAWSIACEKYPLPRLHS